MTESLEGTRSQCGVSGTRTITRPGLLVTPGESNRAGTEPLLGHGLPVAPATLLALLVLVSAKYHHFLSMSGESSN